MVVVRSLSEETVAVVPVSEPGVAVGQQELLDCPISQVQK